MVTFGHTSNIQSARLNVFFLSQVEFVRFLHANLKVMSSELRQLRFQTRASHMNVI